MARPTPTSAGCSRSAAVRIAVVLSLLVVLIGSVRFARFDWTGIPFERGPTNVERVVSDSCTAVIAPYTTSSGRVISPVTVDEQQYLSIVEHLRGTPADQLQVDCLLAPWATRPAVPWVASLLPFDEAVSIALVNLSMTLVAAWAIVFAVRALGVGTRAVAAVGVLFAVSWNTLFFSSAVLVDAAVVAAIAVCWWLLAIRRPWWVPLVLVVSYPIKETVAIVVLPVLAAWLWREVREGAWTRRTAASCMALAVVAAVVSLVVSTVLVAEPDATWPLSPSPSTVANNLFGPVGLVAFLLGTVPLYLPALLEIRRAARVRPPRQVALDPAVVGIAVTVVLLGWVVLAADLSPRFAWVGAPFAASLAGAYLDRGRPREVLELVGRRRTVGASS